MSDLNKIYYVPHDRLDKEKWDRCIDTAHNGLVYAYSFYLDHMAKHWDALVMNDYDAVMPLTWNKKYSVKYLYQPFLAAQLGVFSKNIPLVDTGRFIAAIPDSFRYIDILLNSENMNGLPEGYVRHRANYVLGLSKPYEDIFASYRENIRRNIKRAQQAGCTAVQGVEIENVIRLAVEQMRAYGKESEDNVNRFRKLYQFLATRKMAATYGILSPKNELIASCVFFFSHQRAYYILVGNHPDGRTIGASHALIDAFIKDHAGKDLTLDFEGSDIRNLAFFYSSFGARHEVYPALKINRLPFFLKWLKK